MRPADAFFAVSAVLFVTGVGLVVVAARTTRSSGSVAAAVTAAAPGRPVATVRQIMTAIVDPSATTVFNAVSTTVTDKGTEEKAPRTSEEWFAVGAAAAALAEGGRLLMSEGRAIDRQDWMTMAQAMVDAAASTLDAVAARSPQRVFDAGGDLYTACDNCHRQYQR